jgi:hypothetical protein
MDFLQGAVAGLVGGVVGAGGAIWVWRAERAENRRRELATALRLFQTSADLLAAELRRLTPPGAVAKRVADAMHSRRTTLDWLASPLTERVSPRALQLQDRYADAMNRLLAVAPQDSLKLIEGVNQMISGWTPGDTGWDEEWERQRVELSQYVRRVAGAEPPGDSARAGGEEFAPGNTSTPSTPPR